MDVAWARRVFRSRLIAVALVIALVSGFLAVRAALPSGATSDDSAYDVPAVVDVNPDPDIVETTITADELAIADIGDGRAAIGMAFNGSIPGPEFRLTVGQRVRVHFNNNLNTEATGIHWHGIELANVSDGSQLVQNQVPPGESYIYDFVVPRPGVYWYHPHHHHSTNQVVRGLYGSLIVEDPSEPTLRTAGVLPSLADTHTLMIGDMTICKAPGTNDTVTYPNTLPHVSGGTLPAQGAPHPDDLCDTQLDADGNETAVPAPAGTIANIQPAGGAVVNEGQTVVTNGVTVGGRAGTPAAPGALGPNAQVLDVSPGQGLRFQIIAPTQVRYLRLRLTLSDGTLVPLVRVGGEGGLLNEAILDGGVVGGFDFKYAAGEVVMGPSERVDVVAAIPPTASGVATLWTQDFQRLGTGFANTPTVPVAHYNVTGAPETPTFTIGAGTDLRLATGDPVEVLLPGDINGTTLNPATFAGGAKPGNASNAISLGLFNINGTPGIHHFNGDYTVHPKTNSTRWARLGDTIELQITNTSGLHHPFHMHGFSFQPVTLTRAANPTFTYPPEYVDAVDVPPNYTLTYRFKIEDRPQQDGTTMGGSAGRWVFHCHIFFHAVAGMMSEIIVVGPDGNERPYVTLLPTQLAADEGEVATMTGNVMDPDGDAVAMSANVGQVVNNGNGTWTWSHDTTDDPGTQTVFITGTDPDGLTGQIAFDLDVEPVAPLYRVNAGGPNIDVTPDPDWIGMGRTVLTAPGITFSNDTTAANVTTTDVINTANVDPAIPMSVFQSLARTTATAGNQMNWTFAVPNGSYEVRLHNTEHQSSTINAIGGRVFDIFAEGALRVDNYDILAETGGVKSLAVTETVPVTVTDGVLNLGFTAVTSVAIIRGIEIYPVAAPPSNQPPTISASPNPATVQAGQTAVVDLTTNDGDGDPLTTSITSGPAFATLVGGDLSLSPGPGDLAGSPYTVTVQVDDGEDTASVNVTVNVTPVPNQPPTISAAPNPATVTAGQTGVVDLTTNDGDGDPLTTSITSGPAFATIVGGDLSLSPGPGDVAGSPYTVTVQVDDGEDTDSVDVTVNVLAAPNQPPTISAAPNPITVTAGQTGVVDLTTNDGDGDPLTTSITSGPAFATIVGGDLSLSPGAGDVAGSPYTVAVQVDDGEDTASVNVTVNVVPVVEPPEGSTFGDFDGDGDTDIAVFRPSNGRWYISGVAGSTAFGANGDRPVAADYDGDGDTDFAVWRPSNGRWYVNGIAGSTPWGQNGDVPVPGDYDGDDTIDFAVFRPSNGRWYVQGIAGSTQWGQNGDQAVPGDYNGDGDTELAVFRPSNGRWYIQGIAGSTQHGATGDKAVQADYDGDGDTDLTVFRPSNGRWYRQGIAGSTQHGQNGDIAVPADYDGDGDADLTVFRPSNGRWYRQGIAGSTQHGQNGDIPVPRPIGTI